MSAYRHEVVERIARTCHEVNRAYCAGLGDNSQLPWNESPDWQKASAVSGVEYHLSNPDSRPSDSHANWLKDKLIDGWTWGPSKNPELKMHPCIVEYEKLPKEQQMKDYLFLSVVRSLEDLVTPLALDHSTL